MMGFKVSALESIVKGFFKFLGLGWCVAALAYFFYLIKG